MCKLENMLTYLKENNNVPTSELARQFNASKRHARRAKALANPSTNSMPKILMLDIETLPMEVLVWGLYKQRIPYANKLKDWSMLCWCGKWLFEDKIFGEFVSGKDAIARSDLSIMGIHRLMDEADIVVAHNGNKFDIPKLNTRFLFNGFGPVTPYQSVDTYQVARKQFGIYSNALDGIAEFLGLERKGSSAYGWWKEAAVNGDDKSIRKLFEYCKQDITVLEDVYLELLPWIKSHPNYGLYMDQDNPVCPNCGSSKLKYKGYYYTQVNKFQSFICKDCGAISRNRSTIITKDKATVLIAPVAR